MQNKHMLYFKVNAFKNSVDIDSLYPTKYNDLFTYSNMLGLYNTESTQGHGIQVNDPNLEKPLLKLCDKISNAIYEYMEEVNAKR